MTSKKDSGRHLKEPRIGDAGNDQPKPGDTASPGIDCKPMEDLLLIRRMVDKAADMVFLLGPMGRIQYANESASKALGYTREELQSMTVFEITRTHNPGNWLEHEEELKRSGSMTFENVLMAKDGRLIPVEMCANYARLGDREYNYSFSRDITERKRAEMELEKYRKRLEDLVRERTRKLEDVNRRLQADIGERKRAEEALNENLAILARSQEIGHLGSWSYDCDSEKFEVSDEIYRIYGFMPGEVEPTKGLLCTLLYPDDLEMYKEYFESLLRGRLGGIDYRVVWPDGSVHHLHVIADSNVRASDGRIKTISGITQDITERKRADEALLAAKQQAELYLDLMGHDINNMHQVALGYLELAKDMPGSQQAEFLDKSAEVLRRSTQLIGNVRKLQKLHEGIFQTRDEDVSRILADVLSEYGAVPHKTITRKGQGACFVRANELLYDVFSNLVNNAFKHTKDGREIAVSLDVVGDGGDRYCRVSVEDDGPGIPDDFKERIFNRVHKGSARGMGLGLYLVRSLVDSYGGRVWVEDRVKGDHSKGARFVVMLPAVEK